MKSLVGDSTGNPTRDLNRLGYKSAVGFHQSRIKRVQGRFNIWREITAQAMGRGSRA